MKNNKTYLVLKWFWWIAQATQDLLIQIFMCLFEIVISYVLKKNSKCLLQLKIHFIIILKMLFLFFQLQVKHYITVPKICHCNIIVTYEIKCKTKLAFSNCWISCTVENYRCTHWLHKILLIKNHIKQNNMKF